MHFELSGSSHSDLDPLRHDIEGTGIPWEISHEDIEKLVEGNPELEDMADDLLDQCLKYTKTVLDEMSERSRIKEVGVADENYREKDKIRDITHTATASTIQSFCRAVVKAGKGEELQRLIKDPRSRSECGSFAVRLTLSRIPDISAE